MNMKSQMKMLFAACAITLAVPMTAMAGGDHGDHKPDAAHMADMTDGEVRKIDKEAGKLTLRHGHIKSLDMPAMTMVFAVKDKAMLDKLQPGAKVKFKAVNEAGKITVTEIEPAP